MSAALILQFINAAVGAVPELLALYDQLKSGTAVTATQAQAILTKYGVDRAQLAIDIAAEQEQGK